MELKATAQTFVSFKAAQENLLFDVLEQIFVNENSWLFNDNDNNTKTPTWNYTNFPPQFRNKHSWLFSPEELTVTYAQITTHAQITKK